MYIDTVAIKIEIPFFHASFLANDYLIRDAFFPVCTSVLLVAHISIFPFCLRLTTVSLPAPYTLKRAIFQNLLIFHLKWLIMDWNKKHKCWVSRVAMKTCFESQ